MIAGPNGAGKSTSAPSLLREGLAVQEFVNADAIARGLSEFRPESVAFAAGRIMLARLDELVASRVDFAFETTLASRSFLPWLEELATHGYRKHLVFLALPWPEMAIERVRERVRSGGHDVPAEVIRRRFHRGLKNFFQLYTSAVDSWYLYDNSQLDNVRLIASRMFGADPSIKDRDIWNRLIEESR
jgi:predicted ABC-type ATPase